MPRSTDNRLILTALAFAFVSALAGASNLDLAIVGDHLTVNREPQFLVFVSYFDALRAPNEILEADFTWLEENGISGLRIFPNWWNLTAKNSFPKDTLFAADGSLRPDKLKKLKSILARAAAHKLVVDLSLAYEVVEGMSDLRSDQVGKSQGELPANHVRMEPYEKALVSLTRELQPFRHCFIDIQNEFNGRATHLSDEEVLRLGRAIKSADPFRIITASLANEIGPEEVGKQSEAAGLDLIGWHESRNPWQFDSMIKLAQRVKAVSAKPLYFGEPASMEDTGLGAKPFLTAVSDAKRGGAAAWTFHTRHGFDLHSRSFRSQLTVAETEFLTAVTGKLRTADWGVSTKR